MRLPMRDLIATILVIVAGLVVILWAVDHAFPGTGSARVAGSVILALGFAASASAVVPAFFALLRGNKLYLAATSMLGAAALAGGLMAVISASESGLVLLSAATVVLWAISTWHHATLARTATAQTCPNCGRPAHQHFCEVCGYELIERAKAHPAHAPRL